MKAYILLLLLIVVFSSNAQDLDYLKSQDTIYLVLEDHNEMVTKTTRKAFKHFNWEASSHSKRSEYILKDSLNRVIMIMANKNATNPDKKNMPITVNRKVFLRKNKKQILNLEFLSRYNPEELFFNYLGGVRGSAAKKVFYIIDEESIKKKNKK